MRTPRWVKRLLGIHSPSGHFTGTCWCSGKSGPAPEMTQAESWAWIERIALRSGFYDDHDDCEVCRERAAAGNDEEG